MKKLFLFLCVATLTISSCSKKEDAAAAVASTSCFSDSYNGTYVGSDGNQPQIPSVTVKLTKTGCDTCTLESAQLGNKNVVSLSASSGGGFAGKLSDGSAVSIALNGSQLSVTCTGYAFGGSRQ
jgi:hypothetical protein